MLFTTKTNGKEIEIRKFEFNLFGENTYVIWDPATLQAAVVDPGMAEDFEADELIYFCTSRHLDVKYILLTHAHVDHTFGIEALQALLPRVPVIAHKADAPLAASRAQQAQMFHLRRSLEPLAFDRMVTDKGDSHPRPFARRCLLLCSGIEVCAHRRHTFCRFDRPHRPPRRQWTRIGAQHPVRPDVAPLRHSGVSRPRPLHHHRPRARHQSLPPIVDCRL